MATERWQDRFDRREFEPGEQIFGEGEAGDEMYFVEKGRVTVWRGGTGELPRTVLGTVNAGQIFGEMVLIDHKKRMATASAATKTTLLVMRRAEFNARMEDMNPFMRIIIQTMANHVRGLTEYIELLEKQAEES